MIELYDAITSSGKYPERNDHEECTPEVRTNLKSLLVKVNGLLEDLGLQARVSSGFRPSAVNAAIKTAARRSKHLKGQALDLEDWAREIAKAIMENLHLLERHGLYMEDPRFTKSWCHLQDIPPRSGKGVFIP